MCQLDFPQYTIKKLQSLWYERKSLELRKNVHTLNGNKMFSEHLFSKASCLDEKPHPLR